MNRLLIICFIALSLPVFGQQDAIYSQYSFNPLVINPAYAGSRNSISAVLLHRSQWVGLEGAPVTQTLAIHSPINRTKLALGLNLGHDAIGPTQSVNAALTAAYHIKLRKSKLSLALRGGLYNAVLDRNKLKFDNQVDIYNVGGVTSSTVPSFDFGLYYYKAKFYIGLSLTHLSKQRFTFYNEELKPIGATSDYYLRTHAFLNIGYVFDISENFKLKPSFLLKNTEGAVANLDLSFNALLYNKLWIGISFRNKSSVNFMTEFNVKDYFRIGYAYDVSVNKLNKYNNGSHEIFIGFDFNLKSKKLISPRYL